MDNNYPARHRASVIGTQVDLLDWEGTVERLAAWGHARESRYVVASNVHSVVTAAFDRRFQDVANGADMVTCDGAPVTWMLRQLGAPGQRRINGPDLMLRYFAAEAPRGGKVYLYGGTPAALEGLVARVQREYPGLNIVGTHSPPFRPATQDEDLADVARINASGAHVVFVGLGCPKQELWMAEHRGRIQAVMIGVGAAFDYHAGLQPRAPEWMQHHALEWAHRLAHDPRRLWRRYLFTNLPFLLMGGAQWIASRFTGARPAAQPPVAAQTHVELPYEREAAARPAPQEQPQGEGGVSA